MNTIALSTRQCKETYVGDWQPVQCLPLSSAMVAHTPQTWTLQSLLEAHPHAHEKALAGIPSDHPAIGATHALHGRQGNYAAIQLA